MNQFEAIQFIKSTTFSVQAKLNRKRKNALFPKENDLFDAAAAINQKSLVQVANALDQDKQAKMAFNELFQYVIKVIHYCTPCDQIPYKFSDN